MHADLDQLKADARARQAEAGGAGRLTERLQALPDFEPPRGLWPAIRARAAASDATPSSGAKLALAAGLATVCVMGAWLARDTATVPPASHAAQVRSDRLDQLLAESARLDAILADLPSRSTTRAGTGYAVAALEDTLAMVDDQLSTVSFEPHAPEVAEQLWQERVNLMNSLVQVRYARVLAER